MDYIGLIRLTKRKLYFLGQFAIFITDGSLIKVGANLSLYGKVGQIFIFNCIKYKTLVEVYSG